MTCLDNTSARGNHKTEEKLPLLEEDIRSLAEPQSQQDPKFQSPFQYTRMTAKAMRQALIDQKSWKSEELPCEKTIGNILNRLGYRLRRVQKAKPVKKVRETDAIFENGQRENQASDERKDSLRISIDMPWAFCFVRVWPCKYRVRTSLNRTFQNGRAIQSIKSR